MRGSKWLIGVTFAAALASGCGGRVASSVGGESHFLCETDRDCAVHGAGLVCVERVCTSAGPSTGAISVFGSGGGGSSSSLVGSGTGGAPASSPPASIGGGVSTTGFASPDGGLMSYIAGGVTRDGKIAAAYWTGKVEAAALIDPGTGLVSFMGYLGDLAWWQDALVYDAASNTLFAIGQNQNSVARVYSLSFDTGSSHAVDLVLPNLDGGQPQYSLGGVTADGKLVGGYWDAREVAVLIDPTTGESTYEGELGSLYTAAHQLTYDAATHTLYAAGQDNGAVTQLTSLALDSGRTTSVPLSAVVDGSVQDFFLGGVTSDGKVIAAHWDGAVEAVTLIDPATAAMTSAGALGDLYWWQSQIVYDAATRTVFAIGENATNVSSIYSLRLGN